MRAKIITVNSIRYAIRNLPGDTPVFIQIDGTERTADRVIGCWHGKIGEGALLLRSGVYLHTWNSNYPVELEKHFNAFDLIK